MKAEKQQGRVASLAKGRGRFAVLFAVLALVAVGIYAVTGIGTDGRTAAGETVVLDIPPGATRMAEAGKPVKGVPDVIRGSVGDVLLIKNRDDRVQTVAGYLISPHQTMKIPLNRAGSYETSCSAHRDQSIKMEISP